MFSNSALMQDPTEFRRVMGLFATGVSVVAVQVNDDVRAMTANSFMSVSLEPLLVCVSVGKRSRMNGLLGDAAVFTINILREEQQSVSQFFSGSWKQATPPDHCFEPWLGGVRLIGSLATIACSLHEVLEGGDHRLFLGRVIGLARSETPGSPLLFFGGEYLGLRRPDSRNPTSELPGGATSTRNHAAGMASQ